MVRNILQLFFTVYVIITFVITILIASPLILILGSADNYLARRNVFKIIKLWARLWLRLICMPVIKLNKIPPAGKYIIIANHTSYLDSIALFDTIPWYFRPLGKKEISRIPVIGALYKQIVIMVDRSSHTSRVRSMRLLWRVLKHDGSIVIFPEGTFNETDSPLKSFYDGAFRLAINSQVSILPVIFLDTVHRWHYSAWWKFSPGRNRILYLEPVKTEGMTLGDLPILKNNIYENMERELLKYR